MPVPWRGWGNIPVRVCDVCFSREKKQRKSIVDQSSTSEKAGDGSTQKLTEKISSLDATCGTKNTAKSKDIPSASPSEQTSSRDDDGDNVTARYLGEVMQSAVGLATGVLQYSKEVVVESVRPAYWEADAKIVHCHKCKVKFNLNNYRYSTKHHCRACGRGFCDACSSYNAAVPDRGWDYPVRVCEACCKILQRRL